MKCIYLYHFRDTNRDRIKIVTNEITLLHFKYLSVHKYNYLTRSLNDAHLCRTHSDSVNFFKEHFEDILKNVEKTSYLFRRLLSVFKMSFRSCYPFRWPIKKKRFSVWQEIAGIIRGLNVTKVVSRQALQYAAVPHLRKQAARYMGRITRSCTSGQNGAACGYIDYGISSQVSGSRTIRPASRQCISKWPHFDKSS